MSSRPNILVIMSDQHRASVLGCAGDSHACTPHLDRLAAEGIRFENGYCNNPICVPSRMSFLTGQTTNQIGVWSLSDTIRSDELTWPAVLGAAGYDTAISGRMHHWWPDKHHGFHRRLCGETKSRVATGTFAMYADSPRGREVTSRLRNLLPGPLNPGETGEGENHGLIDDDESTRHAIDFIQSRDDNHTPFALCVGYMCPHTPLRCPAEYFNLYRDMPVELGALDDNLPPLYKTFARLTGFDEGFDADVLRDGVRAYYAMVHFVDDQIGKLVDALRRSNQLENTVIFYISDHGEMLGERGLWFKNQLLESSIRSPMIVRCPARFRRGAVEPALVSNVDLFPTFAEIAGAPKWDNLAGNSLVPLLTGRNTEPFADRPVFIEYADFGIDQPSACIRRRNMKLIAARNYDDVLYDLKKDPGETTNLARDPAYAAEYKELRLDLVKCWDPEDTWSRVLRNQNRLDLIRTSRTRAMQRGTALNGGISK